LISLFGDYMDSTENTTVTIIYYNEDCIELQHVVKSYPKSEAGRVIIPHEFKQGKSIVAVCLGEIVILNKVGDRVISVEIDE